MVSRNSKTIFSLICMFKINQATRKVKLTTLYISNLKTNNYLKFILRLRNFRFNYMNFVDRWRQNLDFF